MSESGPWHTNRQPSTEMLVALGSSLDQVSHRFDTIRVPEGECVAVSLVPAIRQAPNPGLRLREDPRLFRHENYQHVYHTQADHPVMDSSCGSAPRLTTSTAAPATSSSTSSPAPELGPCSLRMKKIKVEPATLEVKQEDDAPEPSVGTPPREKSNAQCVIVD